MYIKQFTTHQVRVPDPLRPGKRVFEDRLIESGGHQISHQGQKYQADEEGWFDVPAELGLKLLGRVSRDPRSGNSIRFYTPTDVDEQVRLGALDEDGAAPTVEDTEERLVARIVERLKEKTEHKDEKPKATRGKGASTEPVKDEG